MVRYQPALTSPIQPHSYQQLAEEVLCREDGVEVTFRIGVGAVVDRHWTTEISSAAKGHRRRHAGRPEILQERNVSQSAESGSTVTKMSGDFRSGWKEIESGRQIAFVETRHRLDWTVGPQQNHWRV